MRYLDEFRDADVARALVKRVVAAAERVGRPVKLMEICGGHTVALCKFGIHTVLPANVTLVSGPGCPVCVTPSETVDEAIWLARQSGVALFTFGDMLRVPGATGTLADAASRGTHVQIMYSPMQAMAFAKEHPELTVVMLGIGFETTAPMLAAALSVAKRDRLMNFRFLAAGKLTPPAMRALLDDPAASLDGFIAPGHVTTVIGAKAYRFIPDEYGKPCVVAGFELCDLLDALALVLEQLADGRHEVQIQYRRSVTAEGNGKAQQAMAEVFDDVDTSWRGLGVIRQSGHALRGEYRAFDVRGACAIPSFPPMEAPGCRCGDMLRGNCIPTACGLFGGVCTPKHPVGPCMVSGEGSCAAYYKYGSKA